MSGADHDQPVVDRIDRIVNQFDWLSRSWQMCRYLSEKLTGTVEMIKLTIADKEDVFPVALDHFNLVQRTMSVCYGLLRPLDLIKPYRMEYDVKLPELGEGNMYIYWRARQTEPLIEEVKADDNLLINLGSMDLQPSFDWKKVEQSVRVITPDFKVWKNGKAETIVIYAKMARGQMTRYIVKNRITNPDALKDFTWEGFRYREDISSENNWIFLQD